MANNSEVKISLVTPDSTKTLSIDNDYEISSVDIKKQLDNPPIIVAGTKLDRIHEATYEKNDFYEEIQKTDTDTLTMSIKKPQETPPKKPPRPPLKEDTLDDNEYFQEPTQKRTTRSYSQSWILYGIAIAALILAAFALLLTLIQFGTTSNRINGVQNEQSNELRAALRDLNTSMENFHSKIDKSEETISTLDAKLNISSQTTQSIIESNIQASLTHLANDILQLNSSSQTFQQQSNNEIKSLVGLLNNSTQLLQSLVTELAYDIHTLKGHIFPSACKDIPLDQPSGLYWVFTTTGINQVYCDMNSTRCTRCNNSLGWTRVANFDLTDPTQQSYPDGFSLLNRTTAPLRTVGRPDEGCVSTTYNTFGIEYSNVCGRIIGYQDKRPDAFSAYYRNRSLTIDYTYVDGVSLTHGQSPRQHIWTFVGASSEIGSDQSTCPCTDTEDDWSGVIPPFVGNDYFCATGQRNTTIDIFFADDPLWDGQGCGKGSSCCEFNSPPWFCKQLPQSTTDDIELRLCGNTKSSNEDTKLEIVELYIS